MLSYCFCQKDGGNGFPYLPLLKLSLSLPCLVTTGFLRVGGCKDRDAYLKTVKTKRQQGGRREERVQPRVTSTLLKPFILQARTSPLLSGKSWSWPHWHNVSPPLWMHIFFFPFFPLSDGQSSLEQIPGMHHRIKTAIHVTQPSLSFCRLYCSFLFCPWWMLCIKWRTDLLKMSSLVSECISSNKWLCSRLMLVMTLFVARVECVCMW